MTLVGRLPVLILDEPTADIDVTLRQKIWELIGDRCRAGSAVILVTHDVAEAEKALTRVAILDKGRVVASGTPAELKSKLAHRTRLELVVAEGSPVDPTTLASDVSAEARVRGRHVSIWVPADEAIPTLEKLMASRGSEAFEDVRLITPTLEDVYLEAGGRSLEEADAL
jgi:ABC-2 type transport system ATP-binding protein